MIIMEPSRMTLLTQFQITLPLLSQAQKDLYTIAGIYTVTLTAGGPAGSDTEIKLDYITVIERKRFYVFG